MTDDVSPVPPAATRLQWLTLFALVAALFAMSWWAYDRLPPDIVMRTLFSGRDDQPASAVRAAFTLAALGWISEIAGLRGAGVALGIGVAVIGNSLPLVTRRNSFVGYLLSVLYDDPDRWRDALRMAGYFFVGAGLLLAALFLVAPVLGTRLTIPIIAVTALAPVLLTRRAAVRRGSA